MINGKQLTILIHVDDILVLSEREGDMEWLYEELKKEFGNIKYCDNLDVSYLGMHIRLQRGEAIVSMTAYREDLLEEAGVTGVAASPATGNLFEVGTTKALNETRKSSISLRLSCCTWLKERSLRCCWLCPSS